MIYLLFATYLLGNYTIGGIHGLYKMVFPPINENEIIRNQLKDLISNQYYLMKKLNDKKNETEYELIDFEY